MQMENRLFDDLARVASGALNTLGGIKDEIETRIRERLERLANDMDLVNREEFEAVRAMAAKARAEQERLEARVAELERQLAELVAAQPGRLPHGGARPQGAKAEPLPAEHPCSAPSRRSPGPRESAALNDVHPELHGHVLNPLDLVERLASGNDWRFERHSEDELALELKGQWCRYEAWLSWHADLGVLQLACSLDLEIPARRAAQAVALLALANERLLLGHFELAGEQRRPAFRYALLFRDGVMAGPELLEEVIDIAVSECERFYPAFGFVGRGLKTPREALQAAMLETEGEA